MNILILIALESEAPDLVSSPYVHYTGVGKVNAAIKTASLIEKFKPATIINFGTAGGITVQSGLHRVGKFVQRDMMCSDLGSSHGNTPFDTMPSMLYTGDGLICSTGDNFVSSSNLHIPADVVDMEAYAIAKACLINNVEFICFKYISDNANSSSTHDWKVNVGNGQIHYINKMREYGLLV